MIKRFTRNSANTMELLPHVRLWMLRMLVPLGASRKFVTTHGLSSNSIADALGLGHWIDQPGSLDTKSVNAELRALLQQAESEAHRIALPQALRHNMDKLTDLVGLTQTDCRILEFAVLLQSERILDDTADLLGQLNSLRVQQTLAVVLKLPESEIRNALHGVGVLARSGLVSLDRSISSSLRDKLDVLSDVFADMMISEDAAPIQLLRGTVNASAPGTLTLDDYAHIQPTLSVLQPYLQVASKVARKGVNVFIYGDPGTGKSELVRALAKDMGCELFEVASEDGDGDPINGEHRLRAFRAAQSFFSRQRAVIVFDEVEDVFNNGGFGTKSTAQTRKAWINRILEENDVPAFWVSNSIDCLDRAFIRRFDMILELPMPPKNQRSEIIQRACGDLIDAACAERLAVPEKLAPAVVTKAASVVHALADKLDKKQRMQALETLIGNTLKAQRRGTIPSADDPNRLPSLYNPAFVHADCDLAQLANGLKQSGSGRLCLYGPPGTGKTAFGRWLAEQLDMPLLVKRASDLLSAYLGESEKQIANAFREAADDNALLLIDEVDSFLQSRASAERSWEVALVNEMLTQMESFPGIFIASTNLMDGLDSAALRRFDAKIKFDYLAPEQALALLSVHGEKLGLPAPTEQECDQLRQLRQLTPGDFAAAARQHRFRPITSMYQFVNILRAECELKGEKTTPMGFIQ